jgi:aminoglycoside N3'-acetyltransferase
MKTDELRLVAKSKLERDLRELGLASGQTVMLHASLKAVGWVVGGPDVVIQALLDILGDEARAERRKRVMKRLFRDLLVTL